MSNSIFYCQNETDCGIYLPPINNNTSPPTKRILTRSVHGSFQTLTTKISEIEPNNAGALD